RESRGSGWTNRPSNGFHQGLFAGDNRWIPWPISRRMRAVRDSRGQSRPGRHHGAVARMAVKWSTPTDADYDDMRKFSGIFNVIDNSNNPVGCHRNGGRG